MDEDMLNRTIGRYEIKEMIGEGAMAKVYRAFDPEINRSVAFKVLKEDHCIDEEYLSRFLREAKAAGALSHSGIVTVFDVGKLDKSPYIMMELLDGCDLGEVLKDNKKLPLKQTLIIALQLAKSLDYAHKSGIVHRDIKPDNIIVMPDGESIKVADFGIARMSESEEAQKTQVGSVLGTPRYMSPEQALGDSVDGRSDLFSVGTIMYEMLSGNKAFDASNMATLMIQIAQKQPEPLKKLCPDLPAGVVQIVQKLLQKSPDKRFQTGNKLAEALGKELSTLNDQQAEQKKHKYIPLKIRWTLSVGAIVGLVSFISINIVFNMQSSAMTKQAVDSGASFAKFISTETAIPILSEDWISLETFIGDAASRDTFSYLIVTDRAGLVRGASDSSLVGKVYQPNENAEFISETEDVYTTSSETDDGRNIFNIKTPILFQSTVVGQIILGLSQDGLDEVKSITGWLMFILALITTSSVAVVMFIFGGLIARPFKVLNESLRGFASGNLDTRISLARNDEIGEVFDGFNSMAAAIQDRYTEVADELAQTDINNSEASENEQEESKSETNDHDIPTEEKSTTESQVPLEDEFKKTQKPDAGEDTSPNNPIELDQASKATTKDDDTKEPLTNVEAAPVIESEFDLNPDETIISTSQIGLDITPVKLAENNNASSVEPDSIPAQDVNPDQTVISTSQIGVDSKPNKNLEKEENDVIEKDQAASETDPAINSNLDLNPDETIISTSQINVKKESKIDDDRQDNFDAIDTLQNKNTVIESSGKTKTSTPAKKPPVKRKPRKKPVKAKVSATKTDKTSAQKNEVTDSKTGESTKK